MIIMHNLKLDTRIVPRLKNPEKIRSKTISIDHQIEKEEGKMWTTKLKDRSKKREERMEKRRKEKEGHGRQNRRRRGKEGKKRKDRKRRKERVIEKEKGRTWKATPKRGGKKKERDS